MHSEDFTICANNIQDDFSVQVKVHLPDEVSVMLKITQCAFPKSQKCLVQHREMWINSAAIQELEV